MSHGIFIDLAGKKIGYIDVLEYVAPLWRCHCGRCGNTVFIHARDLRRRKYETSWCLHTTGKGTEYRPGKKQVTKKRYTPSKERRAYDEARRRCVSRLRPKFEYYGGRGIEFRFSSFTEFLSEAGPAPSSAHTLDRIDVDGHYEPGNVRWATCSEQNRNKRDTVFLRVDGQVRPLIEWAELNGVTYKMLYGRKARGWCDQCAVRCKETKCIHRFGKREQDSKPDLLAAM